MAKKILYIEDNVENKLLVRRLLQASGYEVFEADDGLEGIEMAAQVKPDLIIMDINLPGMDGYEATTKIKGHDNLRHVPIVALTAYAMKGDREKSLAAGCDGYLQKPIDPDTFVATIEEFLFGKRETIEPDEQLHYLKKYSQQLVSRLEEKIRELIRKNEELLSKARETEDSYIGIISSLTRAIEQKHPETAGHSERVTSYAMAIGETLGLSRVDLKILRRAATLHDVGKIVIELSAIDKPGDLAEEEWTLMRRHPEVGAKILEPLPFLRREIEIIRNHHERPDGGGYPRGLLDRDLDLLTGVLTVADAFDAMTSNRAYKNAMSIEESISTMLAGRGEQFMREVVDTFVQLLRSGELDEVLQRNGRDSH
ncbi:MAG: response regulator [Candidatus Lernaella stagnicola]|nr:response regulator [Candidatus Lernaella stagnicola]